MGCSRFLVDTELLSSNTKCYEHLILSLSISFRGDEGGVCLKWKRHEQDPKMDKVTYLFLGGRLACFWMYEG